MPRLIPGMTVEVGVCGGERKKRASSKNARSQGAEVWIRIRKVILERLKGLK